MAVIKTLNIKANVKQNTQADQQYPPSISNRVLAEYDAIVGTASQVNSGAATHTTIQAAHDFVSNGGTILVLRGNPLGNTNISKQVHIIGQGNATNVIGNFNMNAGSSLSTIKYLRFNANLTIAVGSNGSFITDCWIAGGVSVMTDNGSANYKTVISET